MTANTNSANPYRTIIPALVLILVSASCAPRETSEPAVQVATATRTVETPTLTPSPTFTPTHTLIPSSKPTMTPTPTETPTATPTPTYAILRGEVNVEHASCRYGPGAPYLYKYGLVGGSNLEIIGRMEILSQTEAGGWGPATWINVRAIGGNNPCWVNAKLMNITGEILSVAPVNPEDVELPQSPYYGPLTSVTAARDGNEVTISWNGITLRAGDDSEQFPYLIEAWICQNGQIHFAPLGSYLTTAKIPDEPGCSEPSHGRLYAVEKHGYTKWIEIPWPPY